MKYALVLLAMVLAGCAMAPQERYSHLEVGMTKQQVINLLGQPKKTNFNGALVVMEFEQGREQPGNTSCYVIVGREDGRVRSFGRN